MRDVSSSFGRRMQRGREEFTAEDTKDTEKNDNGKIEVIGWRAG
jgi:hypothetical protein